MKKENTNVVSKNQVTLNRGHYLWAASRKVVIRDLMKRFQDIQRLLLLLMNAVHGRFQIKFGMTSLLNKGAFTLIELLVVVLIIGILAAVAVPQYQRAVVKSRVIALVDLLKNIADQQELFYLANARYAHTSDELDMSAKPTCQHVDYTNYDNSGNGEMLACGKDFIIDIDPDGSMNINYCLNHQNNWQNCKQNREIQIAFRLKKFVNPAQNGKRLCVVYHHSSVGNAVCSSLKGAGYEYIWEP